MQLFDFNLWWPHSDCLVYALLLAGRNFIMVNLELSLYFLRGKVFCEILLKILEEVNLLWERRSPKPQVGGRV